MADPKQEVEVISQAVASLTGNFEKLNIPVEEFIGLISNIKKEIETADKTSSEFMTGFKRGSKEARKQKIINAEDTEKEIKKIKSAYERFVADLRSKGGIRGAVGELLPATEKDMSGLQGGMAKLKSSIISELPFGGMLGLMLYGSMKEEQFRALSTGVMRSFQQSGEVAKGALGAVRKEARDLAVQFGMEKGGMFVEFQQSAQQLAQAGVDVEDVLINKFQSPLKGVEETAIKTAVRLDSMFKQGAGTAARNMSQLIRDFNLDATESAKVVAGIGMAARDSGTSVQAFTTSVMRNASAMRMMRVDIKEVTDAQLRFTKIAKELMPGVSDQFAAQYAEQATQQISGGIAGMGVGMSAELGRRMGLGNDLEAYYKFREGATGDPSGDRKVFSQTIAELLKMAEESGGSEYEQRRFLEVGPAKMGFEGSRVLMELKKQAEISGKTITEMVESKEGQEMLARGLGGRARETSQFQRSLLKIQDGLAKIGAGILGAVLAGVELLKGMYYGSRLFGGYDADKSQEAMARALSISQASMGYMAEGAIQMKKGGLDALGTILNTYAGGKAARKKGAGITDWVGSMFGGDEEEGKYQTVTSSEQAKRMLRDKTALSVGKTLERRKIDEEKIAQLVNAYRSGETKNEAGEVAFEEKARELGVEDVGLAKRVESNIRKITKVKTSKGEVVNLEFIIRQVGGSAVPAEGG